jgi:hypothetical protein
MIDHLLQSIRKERMVKTQLRRQMMLQQPT